jgi:hypothetical protein
MVQMRLGLEGRQVPFDVTDALAAALAHADRMRKPKGVTPPPPFIRQGRIGSLWEPASPGFWNNGPMVRPKEVGG